MAKYPSCTVILKSEQAQVKPEAELGSQESCCIEVNENTIEVQYRQPDDGQTTLLRGECFWDHVLAYLEISLDELQQKDYMELLRDHLRLDAFEASKNDIIEYRLHFQNAKICSGYVGKDML